MFDNDQDVSHDAVIVIPGIMGSELVEVETGRVLWGLNDPRWYASAWVSGNALKALRVSDEERAGRSGRIHVPRVLRVAAAAPMLRGIEPYTAMLAGARRVAAHPDAVREFPYDWRLSIEHNAKELAKVAEVHLARWRAHAQGGKDAQLVLVAHSMGGLVARYFTGVLGGGDVRATLTLGTPFYGSAKSAVILSTGRGAPLPLPRRRLRALAMTMPGLHDLLPSYRCVVEGQTSRLMTAADVAALGGDSELAAEALTRREKLLAHPDPGLRALVGVQQKTIQSLTLTDGVATPLYYTLLSDPDGGMRQVDRRGDSTVYRDAAAPAGSEPMYLPQSHSALAKTEEAIAHVCALLTRRKLGPPLGTSEVGLNVPDVVTVGQQFAISAEALADTGAASCRIVDVATHAQVARPALVRRDGVIAADHVLAQPGLYRVAVKAGGYSAVTQLVLVTAQAGPDRFDDEGWA